MIGWDVITNHEPGGELCQRLQLRGCGTSHIKIADEADADAEFVKFFHAGVGAPFLLGPARADLDLAVAAASAVADNKVIAQLIPVMDVFVIAVEGGGAAGFGVGVVNDDPPPGTGSGVGEGDPGMLSDLWGEVLIRMGLGG